MIRTRKRGTVSPTCPAPAPPPPPPSRGCGMSAMVLVARQQPWLGPVTKEAIWAAVAIDRPGLFPVRSPPRAPPNQRTSLLNTPLSIRLSNPIFNRSPLHRAGQPKSTHCTHQCEIIRHINITSLSSFPPPLSSHLSSSLSSSLSSPLLTSPSRHTSQGVFVRAGALTLSVRLSAGVLTGC